MKYRKVGNSGLKVSEISFGTMFFGGAQFQATDNPVSKGEALQCLKKSLDVGINYIDSADIYGGYSNSESIIGKFLTNYDKANCVLSLNFFIPLDCHEYHFA